MELRVETYIVAILLLCRSEFIKGTVMIFPPGVAPVCNGDQIELTCTLMSQGLLEWQFTLTPKNATSPRLITQAISSSSNDDQLFSLVVDSSMLTFSRISTQNISPLQSKLLINPVTSNLNGTEVICVAVATSESATTTIFTINNGNLMDPIQRNLTEYYKGDGVTVILEWTQEYSFYLYNITVIPYLPLNSENQLKVPYNVRYNVTVVMENPCGEIITTFFELYYELVICENLTTQIDGSIEVLDYVHPPVRGSSVTFVCSSYGFELNGTNTSTCMENGEWEPDPGEVECKGNTLIITRRPQKPGDNGSPGTVVGSISGGVILLSTVTIMIIITMIFLLKLRKIKRKRDCEVESHVQQVVSEDVSVELCPPHIYDDTNNYKVIEKNVVYADIGQTINQQQQQCPSISFLDDNRVEYAKIQISRDHSNKPTSVPDKASDPTNKLNEPKNQSLCINLDNLLIQLRPQVTPKWYQFGEAAGIEKEVLDNYAKNCSPEDCIVEMLDYWLRNSVQQPTWKDVAKILKSIKLPRLALDIEGVYTTGKLPVEVDMNWIPQVEYLDFGPEAELPPPPIPPKAMGMIETSPSCLSHDIDHNGQKLLVEHEDTMTPTLPPLPLKPAFD